VLVARCDTILFSKGHGSANLEWNIPNTTATEFRIGSVTKTSGIPNYTAFPGS
jgi:CubicO group peptidase (beta-lactamase class C family)